MCRFAIVALTTFAFAFSWSSPAAAQKKDGQKEAKTDNLFPLVKGTKWEYELNVANNAGTAALEITGVKRPTNKGERAVATLTTTGAGQTFTEEMSGDEKGVYKHSFQNIKLATPILAIKYPAKAGEKWKEKLSIMGMDIEAEMETKATEKVKVKAGEYTTVPVTTTISVQGMQVIATNWYASGIGIVKQEMDLNGMKITMVLVKFTAGKNDD
jgi:DUF3108-like